MNTKVLEIPECIDGGGLLGESARCFVPEEFQGPCAMTYAHGDRKHWAIFPSREVAIAAAAGACRRDVGGYDDVSIYPVETAPTESQRYDQAIDWLFEGDDFENPYDRAGVAAIIRNSMRELARRIAAHPHELSFLEWRDLERVLFEVYDTLGYQPTLTRAGKDGGYDLRLEAEGKTYFVEVKHWSQPSKVGAGIIDRLVEIVIANGATGLLLSTSGFTADVVKGRLEVCNCPVVLGDDTKVISLCRCYTKAESGMWVSEGSLRERFFEGAF